MRAYACIAAIAAGLLATGLMTGRAAAEMPGDGCWLNDTPTFSMTVCISAGAGKDVVMSWDEPASPGYEASYGRCAGRIDVTGGAGMAFTMRVPRQEQACQQDGSTMRLAVREYECTLTNPMAFTCSEVIFNDDGSIYAQSQGVEFIPLP